MKPFTAVLLTATLAVCGGCTTTLSKPHDAQTTVATAWVSYGIAAHDAAAYVTACHSNAKLAGCSDKLIAQLKSASDQAYKALQAADNAIATLPPGSSGIDTALAALQAALVFLQGFTAQVPK